MLLRKISRAGQYQSIKKYSQKHPIVKESKATQNSHLSQEDQSEKSRDEKNPKIG